MFVATDYPGVHLLCETELKSTGCGSLELKAAMVGETPLHAVKWYEIRSAFSVFTLEPSKRSSKSLTTEEERQSDQYPTDTHIQKQKHTLQLSSNPQIEKAFVTHVCSKIKLVEIVAVVAIKPLLIYALRVCSSFHLLFIIKTLPL